VENRLRNYLHEYLELKTGLEKSHGEMVELKCSFCRSTIWRPKALVEREKKTCPEKRITSAIKVVKESGWVRCRRKEQKEETVLVPLFEIQSPRKLGLFY